MDPIDEAPTEAPPADEPTADTPAAEAEGPPFGQRIERDPSDQGTGAPAIPRRDINWPPRPSLPRQPGQTPKAGDLPKGLDTDEPLPDVDDGAAVMRRPPPLRPTSIKTLATRTGSNRLRLAPAEPIDAVQASAVAVQEPAVTAVAAEAPLDWSPRVETALHTAEVTTAAGEPAASAPAAPVAEAAAGDEEANEQAVVEGLRAFTAAPPAEAADAAAADEPLGEDDLFSGLSTLEESSGDE
jgi:hypothetical protein